MCYNIAVEWIEAINSMGIQLKGEAPRMRRVICDIETESLNPSIIWVVAFKDIDNGEVEVFLRPDLHPDPLLEYARTIRTWVGHNFLTFDYPVLTRLVTGLRIDHRDIIDTLVVSRLVYYAIEGGHSLDAWGDRLGYKKPELASFEEYSEEMRLRVIGDVELNFRLYKHYQKYIESPEWAEALATEHAMALICKDMTDNGFYFDIDEAHRLYDEITKEVTFLEAELQHAFPPRSKLIKVVTPKETKHGTLSLTDFRWLPEPRDLSPYSAGSSFSRFKMVPFNPSSPSQVVERLNEAGWRPTERTKGHVKELRKRGRNRDAERLSSFKDTGWKVSEANLETLPDTAPAAARKLKDFLTLVSRKRKFEEWFGVYNQRTHRIHGQFMPIGTWPHRMSHSAPNMGNNVALKKLYGTPMRRLWKATPGRILIGTDMASAHLRVFAHLIDDEEFTKAVCSGNELDGTDPHTLNALALGLDPKKSYVHAGGEDGRKIAKRFIYSFLNGAAKGKVAEILCCPIEEAEDRLELFEERYPGFKELKKKKIPYDAARGFFVGFDGRKVIWGEEHGMLAGYMQNGEVVVMKKANVLWRTELDDQGIPYWQLNFVHDEWQTETEEDRALAEYIGEVQVSAIRAVGQLYNLRCPMDGAVKIGYDWADTH